MSATLDGDLPHLRRRRKLTDLTLSEISIVAAPANTGARQLLHKMAAPEPAMTEATKDYIGDAARTAVAATLAKMAADADAAGAALARMTSGGIQKGQDDDDVAAAVEAARVGEDRPAIYWRGALGQLGAQLLPDAPETTRMQAAMATRDGRVLVGAMTGDRRLLAG